MELVCYFITRHGFTYVLPGKFISDPIQVRFGWYRQVNNDSTLDDLAWLKNWFMEIEINKVDDDDASVTYYVAK